MDTSTSPDRRSSPLWLRTVTVGLVATGLALPSASVLAAEPAAARPPEAAAPAEEPEEADPAVKKSRALFEQGLAAYEADDFAGAAHYWTEAHDQMAQAPELSESRRVLGFDLAQAQMRAYARDHHQSRVTAAKPLLEGFVAWVDRPGHTMDEGEKQDRLRAVELLEQIESESPPPPPPPAPQIVRPEPRLAPAPAPTDTTPDGNALLTGGGVALGAGLASIIGVVAMRSRGRDAEERYNAANDALIEAQQTGDQTLRAMAEADLDEAERDGSRSNIGLLTFMTSTALLTTAGITMLAIGGHRRRRHISASAALSPSSAGASVTLRF